MKYRGWGIGQENRGGNWGLQPAVEWWMFDGPPQAAEVNVIIHSQSRFEEAIDLVVNGRQLGIELLYFCLAACHVSVMSFLLKAFAIRLRSTLKCNLRPLLSFPCLLSPASRGCLFTRRGTLALFGHLRLVVHFR